MLCGRCHGRHFIFYAGQTLPCPECGGVGEVHCCDGLTAHALVCEQEAAVAEPDERQLCPLVR